MLKIRHANSVVCRAALLAPLALSAAALSSCLLNIYQFAVVNESRSPVEVQYTFKDRRKPCCEHAPSVRPAGKETDQNTAGRLLRRDEFTYDGGTLTTILQPGESLFIARREEPAGMSGPGPLDEYEYFPIESLRVRGPSGLAQFEGKQLTHHFEPLGRGVFALTYADRKEE